MVVESDIKGVLKQDVLETIILTETDHQGIVRENIAIYFKNIFSFFPFFFF